MCTIWLPTRKIFTNKKSNFIIFPAASATNHTKYSGRCIANAEYFVSQSRFVRTTRLFNEFSRCHGHIQLESSKHKHCSAHEVCMHIAQCTHSCFINWFAYWRLLSVFRSRSCSALTQLAVSNSTPPPSTSPIPIKVKSEPVSPPRDHHLAHTQSTAGLSITTMNNATSNISHLSHPQSHLIMNTRPSSTGHLTPTPGKYSTTTTKCTSEKAILLDVSFCRFCHANK